MTDPDPDRLPPDATAWFPLVREVAASFGVDEVTDDEAEYLLWEVTPWPVSLHVGDISASLGRYFRG